MSMMDWFYAERNILLIKLIFSSHRSVLKYFIILSIAFTLSVFFWREYEILNISAEIVLCLVFCFVQFRPSLVLTVETR